MFSRVFSVDCTTVSKRTNTPPVTGAALRPDSRSLAQEAFEHIRLSILSGQLREGEKVPEEKIAQALNVSRTPIREALRRLERYGLVVIKPRSYAMVAGVSREQADHIAHTRCELEKLAARYLVRNAGREDVAVLRDLAERMRARVKSGDMGGALLLDSAFHLEMAQRSGNQVVYDLLERLDPKSQFIRIRIAAGTRPECMGGMMDQHLAIVERLEAGDEQGLLEAIESNIVPELGGISALPALSSARKNGAEQGGP